MKSILFVSLLALTSVSAVAADTGAAPPPAATAPVKAKTPQQQRMVDCNAQAKTQALKGTERKSFMSSCLKGQSTATPAVAAPAATAPASTDAAGVAPTAGKVTQQQKMTNCNAEAKTKALTGADRKSFMSTCLKG